MSSETTTITADEILAISDPGEKGRAHHRWPDRLMINVGNVVAWLFPMLMLAIVAQVIMRQAGFNQAWLDDGQWWMYGVAMLTAFGYAITTQSHVRVDIFHAHFSPSKQARIEVFAVGWLFLPFLLIMTDVLLHYSWASIKAGEGSDSPNGLHYLYLLKTLLPTLFIIAIIASWGVLNRNLAVFSQVTLHTTLIGLLPAALFFFTRAIHYLLFWFIYFTNPDVIFRRIPKEPIFEHTTTMAIVLVVILIVGGYLRSRKSSAEE